MPSATESPESPQSPGNSFEPYQTLYRRFRPQRFSEVLGQQSVSNALRNAVRENRVGHAYLFSGPRGTGKTSTARILAKALNCTDLADGEPCGHCQSCVEITRGSSFDVHELDAASNNGVDSMRDLVSRAALGSPGRWKVYIVDEVHMLTTAASNALLKTLEEPPSHVVFVLATTEPQKVLPTIRSRAQHFEFRLLGPDTLADLLSSVARSAGLEVPGEAIESAVRRGRGSARDALSALDQLAAGGLVDDDQAVVEELAQAIAQRNTAQAVALVARAAVTGKDPARLAADVTEELRQGFLAEVAPDLVGLAGTEQEKAASLVQQMGLPALVRAMEVLGRAQVDMRDAPDPRVFLEIALVRLTRLEADDSTAALTERIARLEHLVSSGLGGGHSNISDADQGPTRGRQTSPGEHQVATTGGEPARETAASQSGPGLARATLGALRRAKATGATEPVGRKAGSSSSADRLHVEGASRRAADLNARGGQGDVEGGDGGSGGDLAGAELPPSGGISGAANSDLPDRDTLVEAWGDLVLPSLPARARARFRIGHFVAVEGGVAVFALPNETHRLYCEEVCLEVEQALGQHFGLQRVPLRLVVEDDQPSQAGRGMAKSNGGDEAPGIDDGPPQPNRPMSGSGKRSLEKPADRAQPGSLGEPGDLDEEDLMDPEVLARHTEPAGAAMSPAERLKAAFPGAEEV